MPARGWQIPSAAGGFSGSHGALVDRSWLKWCPGAGAGGYSVWEIVQSLAIFTVMQPGPRSANSARAHIEAVTTEAGRTPWKGARQSTTF